MNQPKKKSTHVRILESNMPLSFNIHVDEELYELRQHGTKDYPVGIYRINVKDNHMEMVPWHWHKEAELIYILEGGGEFLASDDTHLLNKGQSLFINSEVLHSFRIAPGQDNCIFISIVFDPEFVIQQTQTALHAKYIYPITQSDEMRDVLLDEMISDQDAFIKEITDLYLMNKTQEFGYELKTRTFLGSIWLYILQLLHSYEVSVGKKHDSKISTDELRTKEALHYIEEHYTEQITLEEIADFIHLSKSECCRCIKRCMHMTPFEYLMRFRVLKSAQLLADTEQNLSIAELALSVGFNSSSYYNKLFRKYMGCTPSQYRKRLR